MRFGSEHQLKLAAAFSAAVGGVRLLADCDFEARHRYHTVSSKPPPPSTLPYPAYHLAWSHMPLTDLAVCFCPATVCRGSIYFMILILRLGFRLPSAHTCFNHLLLPAYESEEQLKARFGTALSECSGFHIM